MDIKYMHVFLGLRGLGVIQKGGIDNETNYQCMFGADDSI